MEFELTPKISPSEKDFFSKFGDKKIETKDKIHKEMLEKHNNTCCGCNYRVMNEHNAHKILQLHLVEEDENDINDSLFVVLCKACHLTQHIDKAIEDGCVNIVNSSFSQRNLIEMCRINTISQYLRDGDVRILKMTQQEYVEQLKEKILPLHSRIKVIFTNKFEWGDL